MQVFWLTLFGALQHHIIGVSDNVASHFLIPAPKHKTGRRLFSEREYIFRSLGEKVPS